MSGQPPAETDYQGDCLSWAVRDELLEVTLHREPANEIGLEALAELETLAALVRDGAGGARALVLQSGVRAGFSAGADLHELHHELARRRDTGEGLDAAARDVDAFLQRIHAVLNTLDAAPIPTFAALHGLVMGGGLELALTCDHLVADRSARFGFPELRLGLIPGWGGIPRLRRDVGNAVVRDLLLTGRTVGATRAHAVGLVGQLVGRGRAADAAIRTARQAARFEPGTTAAAKRFMKPVPHEEIARERELFLELFTRPEVMEALDRFVTDRGPTPWLPQRGEPRTGGGG